MTNQIILLPKEGYWDWVAAAKEYVLRVGAHLTADPDAAGRFMTPQQLILIAGQPAGYPAHGDIQAWFQKNYPSLAVAYLPASTPAELRMQLRARLEANTRDGL